VNEHISNFTKYTQCDFKDEIQNCIFNYVQLHVSNILINQLTRLHVLKGMFGSEKTFFNTYFTHIFKCKVKCIINNNFSCCFMIITTCLLTHTQFRILVCGYLYVLPQSNDVLQIFKHADVIIIDEISMMTSTMLLQEKNVWSKFKVLQIYLQMCLYY
jgi:hypothetical protein